MKEVRDSSKRNDKDKFRDINTLLLLQHENILEIDEVLYVDDDKSKDVCYTMKLAQFGDQMKRIFGNKILKSH